MSHNINVEDWLVEFDMQFPNPTAGGGPPMSQPGGPGDPMSQAPPVEPPTDDPALTPPGDSVADDPTYPDMPEMEEAPDFVTWKAKYVKESMKGNPNDLINLIMQVRDLDLEPNDRRFVEENFQINLLRRDPKVFEASQEIRKLMKTEFDQTNPAVSTVNHITGTLTKYAAMNEIFIKCAHLLGKAAAHRGLLAALLGGIQVGSGGDNEDIVFEDTDTSTKISTRMYRKWGDIILGRWTLHEDDPSKYLKDAEMERLEGGSPEEKDVLRRRIIMESISERFLKRAFIINVVAEDGTIQHLGCDLGNCLKGAYIDGKLVVRTEASDLRSSFIDEQGSIINVPNVNIYYVKESPEFSETGEPEIEEVEFIRIENGELILSASLDLIKEAAISLQGIVFKETPFTGNPSDVNRISRCVPTLRELIMKDCL